MSDFLSNFSNDNYHKTNQKKTPTNEKKEKKLVDSSEVPRQTSKEQITAQDLQRHLAKEKALEPQERRKRSAVNPSRSWEQKDATKADQNTKKRSNPQSVDVEEKLQAERTTRKSSFEVEPEVEFDPTYQQKKRQKQLIIGIVSAVVLVLIGIAIYFMMHVKVPDFTNQSISEAKKWGKDHQVEIVLEQEYSTDVEAGFILKQSTPTGKRIRKKSDLTITASKGADPEEVLILPDFNELSFQEAKDWAKEHLADNLKITKKYSDEIEENKFIAIEFKDKDTVTNTNYRRKDKATISYSKGKETFEKNIDVPDFKEKAKMEVEAWAKKNDISLTINEEPSKLVPTGMIITQSIAPGEKLAKKDEMAIVVSTGEVIIVPNYYNLTQEEAGSVPGMTPIIKQRYNTKVPYGQLISQSLAGGTALGEKDEKTITLIYSLGKPYLADLRGTNESELQKIIYDTFTSKGVTVNYSTYYVDSDQAKGTIVEQSPFGSYMGLSFSVSFGISNGSQYQFNPQPEPNPETPATTQKEALETN
ncbi:serine/threonine protein kinase [Granulicatella balaenopterae]|uniref:Serine/threonine protein kinase n=1 Tax=Granulicatella balaenopterae TaxID=137733 RepID=A0A1H9MHF9_9LACT|nr:PASTA domain-containing protein [Granulicatella balaenopterae]SER22971.1 serine/threonine protein kinase [Granulicatella balaenopterae]